jgi:hypothetical protein
MKQINQIYKINKYFTKLYIFNKKSKECCNYKKNIIFKISLQ